MNLSTIDNHAFTGFVNLEELIFNENKFTKIESNSFQHLKILKRLALRKNQIEQIDLNGFQGLDNLEQLVLNGNKLTIIESNFFQHLNKLKKLYLIENQI